MAAAAAPPSLSLSLAQSELVVHKFCALFFFFSSKHVCLSLLTDTSAYKQTTLHVNDGTGHMQALAGTNVRS
ncbi:hypothetical protein T4D_5947 [Trichinella pseudospiralis]|uniref:Uncharacterized protein n=1 Tax=Trichinella pseudospiralis TaxID=6337 RepID=A0A0V1F9M1_TRIPS|nr:hypothetical protein T4D_5947 [Trichinella pseudospiralis]